MKKIFLSILVAAATLTSCDMDLSPVGSIDDQSAIQSPNDAARFRAGLYASMRSLTTSGFFTYPEIQMDKFQGTVINGNRGGSFANGSILSGDGDIEGYWASLYSMINDANYFITTITPLLDRAVESQDEEQIEEYERFLAEAKFVRAYCYGEMFDRWCQVYSADKADQTGLGLPLVDEYYPTADRSHYPGRSTMNETLEFINKDLDEALTGLLAYESAANDKPAPMSSYVNSNTVKAFQARMALWIGDYATAVAKSKEVINSGAYTLADTDDYDMMWYNDNSNEIIFMPYMSAPSELSNAIGGRWLSIYSDQADYIPSYEALCMYDDGDVRFDSYFDIRVLSVEGSNVACYAFYKFPGNPALQATAGTTNLMNMPKAFRLSEMYLILAEASALNNDAPTANSALNTLRKYRITGYTDATYAGQTLINEIRDERTKELIGEGFRMSDLRRWDLGFSRDLDHPENPAITDIIVPSSGLVVYSPGDYRYTWPIPSAEIDVNPQLVGQQNPGYGN